MASNGGLDPRTARKLLSLCREFSDLGDIELSANGTSVKVTRSAQAQVQLPAKQPDQAKRKEPVRRSAVESITMQDPPFSFET